MHNYFLKFLILTFLLLTVRASEAQNLNISKQLNYCAKQANKTLQNIPVGLDNLPRSVAAGSSTWHYVNYHDWCSGFWPGILWELYVGTHDSRWKKAAERYTEELKPLVEQKGFDHDLGFMVFNSYGKGYLSTGNKLYKQVTLRAADSLATLFNPKIGTILSWPGQVKRMNWPHNTIIDNMMNLELLFWASKEGGGKRLYNIAVQHALTTMKNHFRSDYSAYHVVVYDTISGRKIKGLTHQGYADSSMWARGQSWAIYGFTMCYRETHRQEFLAFAQKVADVYLKRLPKDLIPFWDFDDPKIPLVSRDASAAAITASALLELSSFVKDRRKAQLYRHKAEQMLQKLSTEQYLSANTNSAFLLHSTGHRPAGSEIDASIIYADYYYLEALLRLKRLQQSKPIITN